MHLCGQYYYYNDAFIFIFMYVCINDFWSLTFIMWKELRLVFFSLFLTGSHFCHGTFDGWLCWDDTEAGARVHQPCPQFISGFDPASEFYLLFFYIRTDGYLATSFEGFIVIKYTVLFRCFFRSKEPKAKFKFHRFSSMIKYENLLFFLLKLTWKYLLSNSIWVTVWVSIDW